MAVIEAPTDWVRRVSELKLPVGADHRLQELMDRNNEGRLSSGERAELESLVELRQELSLVCAKSLQLLAGAPRIGSIKTARVSIDIHPTRIFHAPSA